MAGSCGLAPVATAVELGRARRGEGGEGGEGEGGAGGGDEDEPETGPRGDPIRNVNLHGVYHVQAHEGAHVRILDAADSRWPAYHLHLLNTKTPERVADGRHLFFPKDPVPETSVGDMVRRALVRRAREARGGGGGGA